VRACIFAPAPLLTVTVEATVDGEDDIHVHAGGQGFWIGRMLRILGVEATLCGTFGGEVGPLVRQLIEAEGIRVRAVETAGSNGGYVHDRRSGERTVIAEENAQPLSRHEVDELYGAMLGEALEADVSVIAGPSSDRVVGAGLYERLAADLRISETASVADLSGQRLEAALTGGVTVLKVSDEELVSDGRLSDSGAGLPELAKAVRSLVDAGAANVVVTRGDKGSLAWLDGQLVQVVTPPLAPVDTRGAGDSLTAGLAAGLARGLSLTEAVRLGAAAGGLNVTRHGLATGAREDIERLVDQIELRPIEETCTP
jgi:1-phosphofructokinase